MKRQFNKVKKLARDLHSESAKLDLMIEERWGFSYSNFDYDYAIDTLDYGTANLNFEVFVKTMNEEKKEKEEK